ncbi:hypothetical protein L6164_009113 [Bauhinia variegata]|uniref:Uncharacterized protein n=1 Tax=Bauhinia variegata TaxID=167791 RepID=A0ACB9PKA4_BAUVA|nr:hypothetical protein L6164_009113 [Bauhinia variegata]
MEDSFRDRVDKVFGSLISSSSSSTAPSSLSSLWSLTDDEVEKREWDRSKDSPEREPEPNRHSSPFIKQGKGSGKSSTGFRDGLEEDLDDLDDDQDEVPRSKPDDYDDEEWQIRLAIGRDSTLDYEEEEDRYDKQAIGKENQGDRVYMKDINDDGVDIDSCNVLPTSVFDFVRDPRANHLAAKLRLKEDAEAAKRIDALRVSEKPAPDNESAQWKTSEDSLNPKSILKRKDNPSESKSRKRVRFDPECDERSNEESDGAKDTRIKTSSVDEATVSNQSSKRSQEFTSTVPDYIRNPSRYTHYTFDSSSDVDDESNKQACMDFLSQLRSSKTAAESQANDVLDDLPSVTFISKKKSDATMVENAAVPKQSIDLSKEFMLRETGSSDVIAMEEDGPPVTDDIKKSSQRLNRQYRKKAQDELDEAVV